MSRGKILLTGITGQHIGKDPRLNYDHLTKMYARALRQWGYEVEHRRVEPEEDVTGYTAIIAGMGPINSTATRYSYGTLDFLSRAEKSGVATLFFCDDWQVQLIGSSFGTMVRKPERLTKDFFKSARVDFDWARANNDRLMEYVTRLHENEWPTTILPIYEGGDLSKLTLRGNPRVPARRIVKVDPSPFGVKYDVKIPPDSERWAAWVLGTLSDQRSWVESLGATWQVRYFGTRPSKSENGALTEQALVQEYANSWGVLSPPYWHAGSGWWRLRHQHAISTGSVLLCGKGELDFMGEAFRVAAPDVEVMTVAELHELARAQSDAFYAQMWSADRFVTELGETLDLEISEARA